MPTHVVLAQKGAPVMKSRVWFAVLPLAVMIAGCVLSGCGKSASTPAQDDQTQQQLRKDKKGE